MFAPFHSRFAAFLFFQVVSAVITDNRPYDVVAVGVLSRLVETVGLSLVLTYWGTRTNPFD